MSSRPSPLNQDAITARSVRMAARDERRTRTDSRTAHEDYRSELSALAHDANALAPIVEKGERRGWWKSGGVWRRLYARFTPDAEAFADIVFANDGQSAAHSANNTWRQPIRGRKRCMSLNSTIIG